tara:strand:+ start:76 stop:318 length:243 start_codon:yes stop_codon:yes gene_type:complete
VETNVGNPHDWRDMFTVWHFRSESEAQTLIDKVTAEGRNAHGPFSAFDDLKSALSFECDDEEEEPSSQGTKEPSSQGTDE